MSATTFFIRTLLKATAVFFGVTAVFMQPTLDWSPQRARVIAHKSPYNAAVDALIAALDDEDAGVRRQAALALGRIGDRAALFSLGKALNDGAGSVRLAASQAIAEIHASARHGIHPEPSK
jgi:HEAT repeats